MKTWEKIIDRSLIQRHVEDIGNSEFQEITSFEEKKILESLKVKLDGGDLEWIIAATDYDDNEEARKQIWERNSDIIVLDNTSHIDYKDDTEKNQYVLSITIIKDNDDYFWINLRNYLFNAPDYYDLFDDVYVKCDQLRGVVDFLE
jgi:phosphopantothenoylcysteine synthetase/decarboxylase